MFDSKTNYEVHVTSARFTQSLIWVFAKANDLFGHVIDFAFIINKFWYNKINLLFFFFLVGFSQYLKDFHMKE